MDTSKGLETKTYGVSFKVVTNKYIELECGYISEWNWFEAVIEATRKRDHAGVLVRFELLGFFISFDLYDNRHWDYDNDKWEVCKAKNDL